jgi:hypothetical protein
LLHYTLAARPDARELLAALRGIGASCGPAIPPGVDFTPFDFHFLNLISDGDHHDYRRRRHQSAAAGG